MVAKDGVMRKTSVRAAATSATHLLVQKAALALDVAPNEFEALEPRLRDGRPVLQIADSLINGSGLSRRLGQVGLDGIPEVIRLIGQITSNESVWPLSAFLESAHDQHCHTACYRCIQQYGNRRVHNLLDWRLAIAYLRVALDHSYACGLDGVFSTYPELKAWPTRSLQLAQATARLRAGTLSVETGIGPLGLNAVVEKRSGSTVRFVLVHPLWRMDSGALHRLLGDAMRPYDKPVTTFDLERRPLRALEMARSALPDPMVG